MFVCMKLCSLLLTIFFISNNCYSQSPIKVEVPKNQTTDTSRRNLVVSIDRKQNFYIGTKKIKEQFLDSVLTTEINKLKLQSYTPAVIINADTLALFGQVFKIVRIAKRDSVKVVFNVTQ
jgi:biopolymer transport protein ExbD